MTDKYVPPRKPQIPADLPVVLKDLTREILRAQPADVYAFAAAHFARRIAERSTAAPAPASQEQPEQTSAPAPEQSEAAAAESVQEADTSISASFTRLGARHPVSEDAFCVIDDIVAHAAAEGVAVTVPEGSGTAAFYGVFDGHGGTATSAFCAATMWQRVATTQAFAAGNYGLALEEGFRDTEAALEAHLISVDGGINSGACAVAAIVADGRIFVANTGDSRCIVVARAEDSGAAIAMTTDHKVTDPAESMRLREAGALVHANRLLGVLAVARSIGDFEIKKAAREQANGRNVLICDPDVRTRERAAEDAFIVLASDGVWDALSSDAAAELVVATERDTRSLKDTARRLVEAAARTSDDDITAIIVRLA